MGRLAAHDLPPPLRTVGHHDLTVGTEHFLHHVGPHEYPVVSQSRIGTAELQGSHCHTLAEACSDEVDTGPIFDGSQQARAFCWQIDPSLLAETEPTEIFLVRLFSQAFTDLSRADVTRVLKDLGEAQPTIGVMIVNRVFPHLIVTKFAEYLLLWTNQVHV